MRDGVGMEQLQTADSTGGPGGHEEAMPVHEAPPREGEAAERSASWKVEVIADDSGEWESDPFRFETLDEALAYARDLDLRWAALRDRRVVKSDDPVNRNWPQSRKS